MNRMKQSLSILVVTLFMFSAALPELAYAQPVHQTEAEEEDNEDEEAATENEEEVIADSSYVNGYYVAAAIATAAICVVTYLYVSKKKADQPKVLDAPATLEQTQTPAGRRPPTPYTARKTGTGKRVPVPGSEIQPSAQLGAAAPYTTTPMPKNVRLNVRTPFTGTHTASKAIFGSERAASIVRAVEEVAPVVLFAETVRQNVQPAVQEPLQVVEEAPLPRQLQRGAATTARKPRRGADREIANQAHEAPQTDLKGRPVRRAARQTVEKMRNLDESEEF